MMPAVGYTEMKDSGFPDIGCVPSAWTIMKVKHIFDVICGATPKENPENWDGNIPWIGPSDMPMTGTIEHGKRFISELGYASCGTTLVPQNSIIISTRAPIGKICIAANRLCTNQGCKALVSRNKSINNKFFAYYLRSIIERLEVDGTGTTFKELSTSKLLSEPLIVPPGSEQSAIAAYLDTQCARIDEIIAEAKASIEDYKQWKASIIYEAVTKGLDPDAEMKNSGIPHAGEIPKNWRVSPIKYVATIDAKCDKGNLSEETEVSFAPMECIRNDARIKKTAPLSKDNGTYSSFQSGDIAIAKVTPCFENGNICIMDNLEHGYAFGSSELFSIRPQNISSRFLLYCMQTPYFISNGVATMTGVGGLKRVSSYYIKNALIPLPSRYEQDNISAYLDDKTKMIVELIAEKELLIANLESYKKSLIYEVVTGKRRVC